MKIVKTVNKSGTVFYGLLSEPKVASKKIIIHIPGMSGSITMDSFYQNMHDIYPREGFAFLVGENSGIGTITEFLNSNEDSGVKVLGDAFEKFEDCVEDIESWVSFAKDNEYEEIWLQGHSFGTSKTAYYIKIKDSKYISGLILLSPSDMVGLVHDPIGQKDHDILLPEAKKLLDEGRANQILSKTLWECNYISAGTYINLFGEGSNAAIFNYDNLDLGWDTVNSINVPVIAFTGTKDGGIIPVSDPYKAMDKLKLELEKSPNVKTIVYDGCEHSFEGFENNIVSDVLSFIVKG